MRCRLKSARGCSLIPHSMKSVPPLFRECEHFKTTQTTFVALLTHETPARLRHSMQCN